MTIQKQLDDLKWFSAARALTRTEANWLIEQVEKAQTPTGLFVVKTDLGNDRKNFEGVFSTQELAEKHVDIVNTQYSAKIAYWEECELDKL